MFVVVFPPSSCSMWKAKNPSIEEVFVRVTKTFSSPLTVWTLPGKDAKFWVPVFLIRILLQMHGKLSFSHNELMTLTYVFNTYLGGGFKCFFMFTPKFGEDEPNLTTAHIFQMGLSWNHQLEIFPTQSCWGFSPPGRLSCAYGSSSFRFYEPLNYLDDDTKVHVSEAHFFSCWWNHTMKNKIMDIQNLMFSV